MNALSKFIALTIVCVSPLAGAQDKSKAVTSEYAVEFSKVVDNCGGKGLKLESATLKVSQAGDTLTISIPNIPKLEGKVGRLGKLRANSQNIAMDKGMSSRFGINGRVTGNSLRGVFMAEYFKGNKALCTQSFSVKGKSK